MNLNQKLFVLAVLLLVVSCNRNSRLERALGLAGDNRAELEKVLEHYRKDPDELKYKAACYLVENMPWHQGQQVKPAATFWELFLHEDSLVRAMIHNPGNPDFRTAHYDYKMGLKKELVNSAVERSIFTGRYQPDLLSLDAEFLIENIDAAFEARESGLCSHLPFDEFCEYVLPYRIHQEPVYPVRKTLSGHFNKTGFLDSVAHHSYNTIELLNRYVYAFYWQWSDNIKRQDMGFYNLSFWNQLNCSEQVSTYCGLMRSVGLPVGEAFTPKWRDANGGHSWCTLLRPDSSLTLFTAIYQAPEAPTPLYPLRATKIYRRTYAPQPESAYLLKARDEKIPALYDTPCLEDITAQFLPVRDVEIKLSERLTENNLCWFSVFKTGNWMPVAWGKLNRAKSKVVFKDISVGLTGIACSYDGYSATPCSRLVTVTADGMKYIGPGNERTTLILRRKYPVNEWLQGMRNDMTGTRIQGANRNDFSDTVTVHVIHSVPEPHLHDVELSNPGSYRYYRLVANSIYPYLNIAELEFITREGSPGLPEASQLPVFDKHQPPHDTYYRIPYATLPGVTDSTLCDRDMLTWCNRKWIGLDLGKPQPVNRIRMAARTEHNGIVVGDNYQLFYWDKEWISAGTQQAQFNFLEFNDIPANTLYWLRNLDHGEQEQPFFYEDGEQVFTNKPLIRDNKFELATIKFQ